MSRSAWSEDVQALRIPPREVSTTLASGTCPEVRGDRVYKAKARTYKTDNKRRLYEFLKDRKCVECGESRVAALQFDHVRGNKIAGVSAMVHDSYSWEAILQEIAKCEIRCANCHAVRTAETLGWYRFLDLEDEVVESSGFHPEH